MTPRPALYDLYALLETNDQVLSDTARIEVQSRFRDGQRYLVSLDIQIRNLQADIDTLLSMRKRHLALLQAYRTIMAPHRKLPNELLSKIFIHCVADVLIIPPGHRDPLWTLIHVCSKWRQVALGTPSLWNQLQIDYSHPRPNQLDQNFWVKQLFSRTDYAFTLDIRNTSEVSRHHDTDPINTLIVPHIRRLKGLTLDSSAADIDPLFELPPGTAEVLEEVSICVTGQNYIPLGPVTVLQHAPRLRRVTFKVSHFHPNIYRLPWAQLSELYLPESDIHPDIGYAILSSCTSLVRCTLKLKRSPVVAASSQEHLPLALPHLSSLVIHVGKCSDYNRFFQRFAFPRLSSFEVIDQDTLRTWDPSLTPVITRSPLLQRVSLLLPIRHSDIESFLEKTSSIVELCIPRGNTIPDLTLAKIALGKLVPKLESLTCKLDRNSLTAHLNMVEIRHASKPHTSGAPCAYVFWADRGWRDTGGEMRLSMLKKKGLNITLCRV